MRGNATEADLTLADIAPATFPLGRFEIQSGHIELAAGVFDIEMVGVCSVCKHTFRGALEQFLFHLKNHEEKG